MTTPATLQGINRHWASFLGCQLEVLSEPHTVVVSHGGLAGYQGAFLFRRGPACIVSVPDPLVESVANALGRRQPDDIFDVGVLAGFFGRSADRVIGPAWLACADATDFRPADTRGTRLLDEDDAVALRRLAEECTVTEWEHGSVKFAQPLTFGCFLGGEIVAAGRLERRGENLLEVGIITHPAYRGNGYGQAVVGAMTAYGLEQGDVMHYQTLQSNAPSVAVARVLGYQEYAATISVRFKAI